VPNSASLPDGVEVLRPVDGRYASVLTNEALSFVAGLQRTIGPGRERILAARAQRWQRLRAGEQPDFVSETADVRDGDWQVAAAPPALANRRVEITGPTEAKMLINAFHSGANVFMVDFEDANSPTWANMVGGQANLTEAIEGSLEFTSPEGKEYRLAEQRAVPVVRPRGWHLVERNVLVDGEPISASLFDFGLCFFHNARRLLDKGLGPYFYLPKLEGHLEARLWNDTFNAAQDAIGLDRGTIRATVLIETILGAFEMEEILYELRDHGAALNAGRWDYLFSIIKKFCDRDDVVLPDRNKITMTAPFMSAYTELLVRTCHRRGAHAIGGMAAFIPSRRDEAVNQTALAKVNEDKERESGAGFDGTWVAHPDLVPVARVPFDAVLGDRPNQVGRQRDDVSVGARDLLNFTVPGADVTEEGLHNDVAVGLRYLQAWLTGNGAAGIYNLMEDVATAEIARSQVWQWIQRGRFPEAAVRGVIKEEVDRIREEADASGLGDRRLEEAETIFSELALGRDYAEFLTLSAYSVLE
jgi:malate synthase